jgi:hypothetical protein
MPGHVLTIASSIQCIHGGQAILLTSNARLFAGGAPALLESDVLVVVGCPFTLPNGKYSPCVKIEWSAGASQLKVGGVKVLVDASIGRCVSGEGAPQGIAIVNSNQVRASAQ